MVPVYKTGRVTLYQGDALEALPDIPRKSIGLLATDPPYGVRFVSGYRRDSYGAITGDDGSLDMPQMLGLIVKRSMIKMRHVYVFGYRPDELAAEMLLSSTAELIWNKGRSGMGDLSQPWAPIHEKITFGVYVPSKYDRDIGRGGLSARMRQGSILSADRKDGNVSKHPTQKPVSLMRQIVESSSCIGDTVLDPFAGSGSTLVAAVLSGRKAVGVEIDERYVKVAVERLAEAERIADLMEAA